LGYWQDRHRDAARAFDFTARQAPLNFLVGQVHDGQLRAGRRLYGFTLQVAQDRGRSFVPAIDRFDHESGARDTVSGRENPWPGGREGVGIDCDRLSIGEADPGVIGDESQASALTDREDHGVAGDDVIRAWHLLHIETARFIETKGADLHTLDTSGATVFVGKNAFERKAWVKLNPLFLRRFYLPTMSGHLLPAFQEGHGCLSAQAHDAASDVNGYIPASQNENPLSKRILDSTTSGKFP
jgi:hypothetical protein